MHSAESPAGSQKNIQLDHITNVKQSADYRKSARELAFAMASKRKSDLARLEAGALYIILFYRSDKDNDFHWALYHHIDASIGGRKYHIVGSSVQWYPDHGEGLTTEAMVPDNVVGIFHLKNIGTSQETSEKLDRIVTAEDEQLADIDGLTCRVYVGRACEKLREAGFLSFPKWEDLQAEVFGFGNVSKRDFVENTAPKPRPLGRSRVVE